MTRKFSAQCGATDSAAWMAAASAVLALTLNASSSMADITEPSAAGDALQ